MNKKISKIFGIIFLVAELLLVPKAIELMLNRHLSALSPEQIIVMSMTFGSVFLCIIMSFCSLSEIDDHPTHTFLFELMVFLCCVAPMTELFTRALNAANMPVLNMAVNTVYYLIGINIAYVIMLYEFLIIGTDGKPVLKKIRTAASILMIIDSAATLLNIRFGYFFTITADGSYKSAPTYWLAYIPPVIIIVIIFVTALKEMRPSKQRTTFLFFWVFAIAASVLQMWQNDLTLQYTGYTLSVMALYMNVQIELNALDTKHSASESSEHEN